MLTQNRNSYYSILNSALRKCTMVSPSMIHAECTPSEYITLCEYFGCKQIQHDYDYVINKLKTGECKSSGHYFTKFKKCDRIFPKDFYYRE